LTRQLFCDETGWLNPFFDLKLFLTHPPTIFMNDSDLLDLIRCPVDGQSLKRASEPVVAAINQLIASGKLRDASDAVVQDSIDGGLITTDASRMHAIRAGIPTLIPGEAIPLPESIRVLI
jgi:uncharacterized protein YbaR (Trm112 family)